MHDGHDSRTRSWLRSPTRLVLLGLLAVAAFFLVTEHRAHTLGLLPYVLVLGCLLLHRFMHGGHSEHRDGPSGKGRT
jgi:hypothetical protein